MTGVRTRLTPIAVFDLGILGIVLAVLAVKATERAVDLQKHLGTYFVDWTFYARTVARWSSGGPIFPGGQISTLRSTIGEGYAYPPVSVPLMLPFAIDPWGAFLWTGLLVTVLLSGIFMVVYRAWPDRPLPAFALVIFAMSLVDGILEGIAVGNVNIATAGALGWVWATRKSAVPSGSMLGVLKVFPIALAAPGGTVALAKAFAIAAGLCIATLPLVGVQSWVDYIHGLAGVIPLCGGVDRFNASLACILMPTLGPTATLVGLLLGGAALLVALWSGRTVLGMAGVTGAIMLPAAELHAHYFTIVFVLAVIALTVVITGDGPWISSPARGRR